MSKKTIKSINEYVKEIHQYAKDKGWWSGTPRSPLEVHMLVVTEVGEATEEVRNGKPDIYWQLRPRSFGEMSPGITIDENDIAKIDKPEGEAIELVDVVIRIMDYFGHKGWDMEKLLEMKMAYNQNRPYRHGNKKY